MRTSLRIGWLVMASGCCYGARHLASGSGSANLYAGWFTALTVAGFGAGYVCRSFPVWAASSVTWSQSAWVFAELHAVGEIQAPSRSTGGMVTWAIPTFFLVLFSPIPAAAGWGASRMRRGAGPSGPDAG